MELDDTIDIENELTEVDDREACFNFSLYGFTNYNYNFNHGLNSSLNGNLSYQNNNTNMNHSYVLDYLNVTKELPIQYAQPLYGYFVPFLLVITIIANTLIVVVLSKRHMRTPTNVVLMAMALCDMFTLLFPAPWLFYMYTLGNHYKPLAPVGTCYAYKVMNEVSFYIQVHRILRRQT